MTSTWTRFSRALGFQSLPSLDSLNLPKIFPIISIVVLSFSAVFNMFLAVPNVYSNSAVMLFDTLCFFRSAVSFCYFSVHSLTSCFLEFLFLLYCPTVRNRRNFLLFLRLLPSELAFILQATFFSFSVFALLPCHLLSSRLLFWWLSVDILFVLMHGGSGLVWEARLG